MEWNQWQRRPIEARSSKAKQRRACRRQVDPARPHGSSPGKPDPRINGSVSTGMQRVSEKNALGPYVPPATIRSHTFTTAAATRLDGGGGWMGRARTSGAQVRRTNHIVRARGAAVLYFRAGSLHSHSTRARDRHLACISITIDRSSRLVVKVTCSPAAPKL